MYAKFDLDLLHVYGIGGQRSRSNSKSEGPHAVGNMVGLR